MKKVILALAAAACFALAAPATAMPVGGHATVIKSTNANVTPVWHRRGHVVRKRVVIRPHCRTVTTKTYRHGRVIIKKVRRCW